MEIFSSGQLPAARHRVMETPYARRSIAFFQDLKSIQIAPLEPFVSAEHSASYPSVNSNI
ncbi:hypothetical protein C2W62_12810 [Candidatus Entotheonella serta]|nr:hypothetical protein C2W62_12810 [Candidatus Entotheonella serta]